jgi:hypothetical protein
MARVIKETIRRMTISLLPPFQGRTARVLLAAVLAVAATSTGLAGSFPFANSEECSGPGCARDVRRAGWANFSSNAHAVASVPASAAVAVDIPPEVLDPNFNAWQPPQPVRVVALPGLPDIAAVRTDMYGPFIVYNPVVVAQTPPKVDAFYLAHEYGHIYLNTANEVAADEFAARIYAQVDPSVVRAVAWWMTAFPNGGDMTHPPSVARARNICRISGAC